VDSVRRKLGLKKSTCIQSLHPKGKGISNPLSLCNKEKTGALLPIYIYTTSIITIVYFTVVKELSKKLSLTKIKN